MAVPEGGVDGQLGLADRVDVGVAAPGSLPVLRASTLCCVEDEAALDAGGHLISLSP
jgi:hypothetical protein